MEHDAARTFRRGLGSKEIENETSLHNKFNKRNTDDKGLDKVMFMPTDQNGNYFLMNFNDSVKMCAKYNSTLFEINSPQKQNFFESYISEILKECDLHGVWINALRDSSGIFKWLNSGNEFDFNNWKPNEPLNRKGYDYVFVDTYAGKTFNGNNNFGKWISVNDNYNFHVICEGDDKSD